MKILLKNSFLPNNVVILKILIFSLGYYYQAEILGQQVTWVVPHAFAYEHPQNVDIRLMSIFVEFYTTVLGFVNYRLYHNLNLIYPPALITNVASTMMRIGQDDDMNAKDKGSTGKVILKKRNYKLAIIPISYIYEIGIIASL